MTAPASGRIAAAERPWHVSDALLLGAHPTSVEPQEMDAAPALGSDHEQTAAHDSNARDGRTPTAVAAHRHRPVVRVAGPLGEEPDQVGAPRRRPTDAALDPAAP